MPSPFPGMNPFLELPGLWTAIHKRLIVAIADTLNPQLRPHYRIEIEKQWYLQVRQANSSRVVAVIEILSPKNKRTGEGRRQYLEKRNPILASATHLVEIDLLRRESPMPMDCDRLSTYRILVSRSEQRPQAMLYAFGLRDRIPPFPLPLDPEIITEPVIDLQTLLNEVYDRGSYDLAIDYHNPLVPKLSEQDAIWVETWLKQNGLV